MADSIRFFYQLFTEIKSEKRIILLLLSLYFLLCFMMDFENTTNIYTGRGFTPDISVANFLDVSFLILNIQVYTVRLITIVFIVLVVNISSGALLAKAYDAESDGKDLKFFEKRINNSLYMMLISIISTFSFQEFPKDIYAYNTILIFLFITFLSSLFWYIILHYCFYAKNIKKSSFFDRIIYTFWQLISMSPVIIGYFIINRYTAEDSIEFFQKIMNALSVNHPNIFLSYIRNYHNNDIDKLLPIFILSFLIGSYLSFIGLMLHRKIESTLIMSLLLSIFCVIPFSSENYLRERIFKLNMIQCSTVYNHANFPISGLLSFKDNENAVIVKAFTIVDSTKNGTRSRTQRDTIFIKKNDIKSQKSILCSDAIN